MNRLLSRSPFALLAFVCAFALLLAAPPALAALRRQAADFVPPMTPAEARARVALARQADEARRATLALPAVPTLFVEQSRHHLSDRAGFLSFWRRNGGALIFGYPVSEEIVEDGRVVQYFERARFEYHPERLGTPDQVQLSLLGRELTQGRDFPAGQPGGGERFFPETGHTLSGTFLRFWLKRGGLQIFGYPISEPIEEVSPIDGQVRLTQYFERARFEDHPEELAGFYRQWQQSLGLRLNALHEVQLTDLGRQAAKRRGRALADAAPLEGMPAWAPWLWQRRIEVNLSTQQLTAYEGDTPVFYAPVATGRDGFNTPTGTFAIYSKLPIQTMTGAMAGEEWNVPDIPWVQYVVGGVALHGTYWHDQWGTGVRMSHGCINLNIDDAQWLYEWADIGTQVDIY